MQFRLFLPLFTIWSVTVLFLSCSEKDKTDPDETNGRLTGTVTKSDGSPLNNVTILVDHSIFFNSNLSTRTNSEGRYSIKIPAGSWYAFAQHIVTYNGLEYSFYLKPDQPQGFGAEGGVRNFTWALTGNMPQPLSGTFGGLITFDNFPGKFVDDEKEIEWKLEPVGTLIDGSTGQLLTKKSQDAETIADLPIGRYELSASYEGEALQLRKWNTDDAFETALIVDFQPVIAGQCHNCFKLEYRKN